MTATTVDVRPLEEHVAAMTSATNLFTLTRAFGDACTDGYAGATVADLLCGSPASPLLLTVEHLFKHLHRDLLHNPGRHTSGLVVPASRDDGGRGPAMAGPR